MAYGILQYAIHTILVQNAAFFHQLEQRVLSHPANLEEDVRTYPKSIGGQQAQAVAAYPWHPPNLLQTVSGPSLNTQGRTSWD